MQPLAGTSSAGTAYSAAQVLAQMAGPARESWTWDWLSSTGVYQGDLTPYVLWEPAPQITHDVTQAVKRTCLFTMRTPPSVTTSGGSSGGWGSGGWGTFAWGSGGTTTTTKLSVNFLQDLVRPNYRLYMPDGGFLQWSLGTFLFGPPLKTINEAVTLNQFTARDLSALLADRKFGDAFTVAGGVNYLTAVRTIVALVNQSGGTQISVQIPDPGLVLPASQTWDGDQTLLKAVNDLLGAINFFPVWFDAFGVMRSGPVPDYNYVLPGTTWDTSRGQSIVVSRDFTDTPDLTNTANIVKVVAEDPRTRKPIVGYWENSRPDSPVSRRNWHDVVMIVRDSSIPTEDAANIRARVVGQKAARIYSTLQISTLSWPASEDSDVINLLYQTTDEGQVDLNYLELGWTMSCAVGAETVHRLQRIVPTVPGS